MESKGRALDSSRSLAPLHQLSDPRCFPCCHRNDAKPEPGAVPSPCTRIWGPAEEVAPPTPDSPQAALDGFAFVFSQTNHGTPALLPPGNSALPCSLWRHFSALLRDVFKAPLFLFIVGSWKPFPGRSSALCAWDRGELSLSSGACNPCPSPAEREIPDLQIAF